MSAVPEVEELRLYDKKDVMARAHLGKRMIEKHAADPACPLKFQTRRAGLAVVCTADTLRAYLSWLLLSRTGV